MPLQDKLESKENVIEQFDGIKFHDEIYNCVLTDSKLLLHKEGKQEDIKLEYNSMETISFEKVWYIDLKYLILFSFTLAFVFLFVSLIIYLPLSLPPPQVWPPADSAFLSFFLYPGIACVILGIVGIVVYYKMVKFSLTISSPEGDFQLFSTCDKLLKLNLIINNMKTGGNPPLKQGGPFEFPFYLNIPSRILIGISAFIFVLIGWLREVPFFVNIFIIPFFLLIIGFILAVMSYNEKKIKKNYFKIGLLLIFLGSNGIWFQIYINTIPIIGFVIIVIGALLFFDSYSIGETSTA